MASSDICGVQSASGPNREMLACAYEPGHDGPHSWAALPTFPLDHRAIADEIAKAIRERQVSVEQEEWAIGFMRDADAAATAVIALLLGEAVSDDK